MSVQKTTSFISQSKRILQFCSIEDGLQNFEKDLLTDERRHKSNLYVKDNREIPTAIKTKQGNYKLEHKRTKTTDQINGYLDCFNDFHFFESICIVEYPCGEMQYENI